MNQARQRQARRHEVGKMLGDLGGAFSVPTVRIGFRTGLFDCLYRHGPARIPDLASRTGLADSYVREWAFAQAANGYVDFDAEQERFSLTPEQAMVFATKDSPSIWKVRSISRQPWSRESPKLKRRSARGAALLGAKVAAASFAPSARSFGRAAATASSSRGSRL